MIQGNIYRIMIGCPSDIKEEVQIAKRIILKWTCTNAEAKQMVLLPLYWEDDAYPGYGAHPQKMLDKQLVERSDMLICIFGSKIGTETDTSDSGSIEEIEEHVKAGKQVMIFFKKSVDDIDEIEPVQLQKIKDLRKRIQDKAMWWEYGDYYEFGELLRDKLTLFLNDNWSKNSIVATDDSINSNAILSEEERAIFSRWANNPVDQSYMHITTKSGTEIHLGYKLGFTIQNKHDLAEWEDFLERLERCEYIKLDKYDKYNHPIYKITKRGYDYAETLPRYDENGLKIS